MKYLALLAAVVSLGQDHLRPCVFSYRRARRCCRRRTAPVLAVSIVRYPSISKWFLNCFASSPYFPHLLEVARC